MKVAVWDTYVKSRNGGILHFDVIVPEEQNDPAVIYSYANIYVTSLGEPFSELSTEQCRFCHIETPSEVVIESITDKGYYILEMETIPQRLPPHPTRRNMILHLRAHYPQHRFADFKPVGDDELKSMITALATGAGH
jgi:hypothetical protein